jgi:LuxR family maltose regulon positive regulatory protein
MIATRQSAEKWLAHIESHYGMSAEAALTDDSIDDHRRAALLEVLIARQQAVLDTPAPRSHERLLAMQARLSALPGETVCLANTAAELRPVMLYDLGFDASLSGDVERAARFLEEAIAGSRRQNNHHLVQIAAALLANVLLAQGRLREAQRTLEQALAGSSQAFSAYTARAHASLGQIFYEWSDLNQAGFHFEAGLPMARAWNQWDALFVIVTGLARISKRRGDPMAALSLLDDFRPQNESLLDQTQALRLAWTDGADSALSWPGSLDLSAASAPTPFNESLLLDVTRAFIAVNHLDDASTLAHKILESAKEGGRNHAVIQADILLSKIFAAQGNTPEALARIAEALQLAEPEKYLSVFVDEGATVRALLLKIRGNPSAARVLAGFAPGLEPSTRHETGEGPIPSRPEGSFEALSGREREVLQLVAAGCSNQEIASRLVISITTVKTHMGNIFHKLGVTSRTQAIARAESLGLLSGH